MQDFQNSFTQLDHYVNSQLLVDYLRFIKLTALNLLLAVNFTNYFIFLGNICLYIFFKYLTLHEINLLCYRMVVGMRCLNTLSIASPYVLLSIEYQPVNITVYFLDNGIEFFTSLAKPSGFTINIVNAINERISQGHLWYLTYYGNAGHHHDVRISGKSLPDDTFYSLFVETCNCFNFIFICSTAYNPFPN